MTENYLSVAEESYNNGELQSTEEFKEDINRATLINRWINCYKKFISNETVCEPNYKLFINHCIIFNNVFGEVSKSLLYYLVKTDNHPELNAGLFIINLVDDPSVLLINQDLVLALSRTLKNR